MKTRNWFLPEDAWKQEFVDKAVQEYLRSQSIIRQKKTQDAIKRLVEAKESHNKAK